MHVCVYACVRVRGIHVRVYAGAREGCAHFESHCTDSLSLQMRRKKCGGAATHARVHAHTSRTHTHLYICGEQLCI